MRKPIKKQPTFAEIEDDIYNQMPVYEITEEDVDGMFRQYQDLLKDQEKINLDLDFDLE